MLQLIITLLNTILMCAWFVCHSLLYKSVDGTEQRYFYATWAIALAGIQIATVSFSCVLDLVQEDYIGAAIGTVYVLFMFAALKLYFNHDNWFNKQFKRLKSGLKNLKESLSRAFSPIAMPSPA